MAKEEKEKKVKSAPTAEQIEAAKAAKAAKKAEKAGTAQESARETVETGAGQAFPAGYTARLLKKYNEEIAPALAQELGIKNRMAIPRITKVVISAGLGKAITEKPRLEAAVKELTQIAGQKAVVCQARKSVSNFKLRQGMEIGAKVTLRGQRMWEFMDRLITLAIPRVKDFRGLRSDAFDGRGNYNLGLTEQTVFPEVQTDRITFHQGLAITIVTTAVDDKGGFALLKHLGMPFQHDEKQQAARKAG
jgi:large subunit ribosomal protein L5